MYHYEEMYSFVVVFIDLIILLTVSSILRICQLLNFLE